MSLINKVNEVRLVSLKLEPSTSLPDRIDSVRIEIEADVNTGMEKEEMLKEIFDLALKKLMGVIVDYEL